MLFHIAGKIVVYRGKHGGSMFCQDLKRRTEAKPRESASPQRPKGDEGTNPLVPTIMLFHIAGKSSEKK